LAGRRQASSLFCLRRRRGARVRRLVRLQPRTTRALIGATTALSLGIGKELYDATGRGDPSFRDLTWDVIGTAVGVGLSLGVDLLLSRATASSASSGGKGLVVHF
jgi:hypothetical protein